MYGNISDAKALAEPLMHEFINRDIIKNVQ